jgi:hypothetical protein
MRIIVLTLAGTLVACGPRAGEGTGIWSTPGGEREVAGPAVASWCAERGRILLELSHEQGSIGVLWRYTALAPDSLRVALASREDTGAAAPPSASAALRYVDAADVRGYAAISGGVRITAVDSSSISATAQVRMAQVEGTDTTELTASFHRVPLTVDQTVCDR